jgi:hypothetical protein
MLGFSINIYGFVESRKMKLGKKMCFRPDYAEISHFLC